MNEKFFKKRKISIVFEKKTSKISNVNVEMSRKFSVLSILYLFFNANLLKICEQSERKIIFIKFVDDVTMLTYSTCTKKTAKH